MGIEKRIKETQLEFPFLEGVRWQMYAQAQAKFVRSLYGLPEHPTREQYAKAFDLYTKTPLPAWFRKHYFPRHFYDSVNKGDLHEIQLINRIEKDHKKCRYYLNSRGVIGSIE